MIITHPDNLIPSDAYQFTYQCDNGEIATSNFVFLLAGVVDNLTTGKRELTILVHAPLRNTTMHIPWKHIKRIETL